MRRHCKQKSGSVRSVLLVLLTVILILPPRTTFAEVTNASEEIPGKRVDKREKAPVSASSSTPVEKGKPKNPAPAAPSSKDGAGQENPTGPKDGAGQENPTGPKDGAGQENPTGPKDGAGQGKGQQKNTSAANITNTTSIEELAAMPLNKLLEMKIPNVSVSLSRKPLSISDTPGTIYTWSAEELEAYGFRHLRDVLEVTPGVALTYNYKEINGGLRGYNGNFNGVILLINGRRVMDEFYKTPSMTDQFPLNQLSRIEIVQGPISTLYGAEALQGVINLITKADASLGNTASVDARFASFNTKEVSVNWLQGFDDGSFVQAAASFHDTDNPDLSDFVDDTDRYSRSSFTDNIRIKTSDPLGYGYFYSPNRAVSVNSAFTIKFFNGQGELFGGLDYYHNNTAGGIEYITTITGMGESQGVLVQPFLGGRGYFLNRKLRISLEYTYHYDRAKTLVHSIPLNIGDQQTLALFSGAYGPTNLHRLSLQADWSFPVIDNQVYAGVESFFANYGHIVENVNGRIFEPIDSPLDWAQNPLFRPYMTQQGMSVFMEDQQTLWERLRIIAGLRYNRQSYHEDVLLPRAGMVLQLNDHFTFKYFYGTSFKTVAIFSMTKDQKEVEADPSTMHTHEGSLVTRFMGENFSLLNSLSVFYNQSRDYLFSTDYVNLDISQAMRDFWTAGFEDQLKIAYGDFITGVAGLSYVRTKSVEVYGKTTDADKVPHWKATAGLRLGYGFWRPWLSRLSTALHVIYVSSVKGEESAPLGSKERTELFSIDPYVLLNATVTLKDLSIGGNNRAMLQFIVHNLLDSTYYHINPYAMSPIQFLQEGMTWMLRLRLGY